ncbi:MAG: ankyrin repeat domain-containing protein [Simkaniaceae bacterium]|nr:ankyrin repeat domain-containing protein [Simkaniaceae bacterium]
MHPVNSLSNSRNLPESSASESSYLQKISQCATGSLSAAYSSLESMATGISHFSFNAHVINPMMEGLGFIAQKVRSLGLSSLLFLGVYHLDDLIIKAADRNDLNEVQFLLSHGRVTSEPVKTALVEKCERILSADGSEYRDAKDIGYTDLEYASAKGCLPVVKMLIAAGADVDRADEDGNTVLMKASLNGRLDIVKALVAAGACVDCADKNGVTALMKASLNGCLDVVKVLVAADAGVDCTDKNGETALMKASCNGYLEVVKALVEAGADVDCTDKDGNTALNKARTYDHLGVFKELIVAGADIGPHAHDPRFIRKLIRLGAIDWASTAIERCLIRAAHENNIDIVRNLIGAGLSFAREDSRQALMGDRALIRASGNGHLEVVEELLGAGADVGYADEIGSTALQVAILIRRADIIELLRRAGAER